MAPNTSTEADNLTHAIPLEKENTAYAGGWSPVGDAVSDVLSS